jgi:hypothetical protein
MTMAAWQATVTDDAGNVVPNAAITVQREVAGLPPAPCYSDKAGSSPLGSSFSADSDGYVRFYAAGGFYRITAASGGFSRTWRDVAIGTAAGTDAGVIPTAAAPQQWTFDDATADADPGDGEFRLNHATPASATAAYIDNENAGGADVSAWLDTLDDGGDASVRGVLSIFDPELPSEIFRMYAVSGSVVDGTGYRKLTLAHIAGAGSFTAGSTYTVSFASQGVPGAVPAERTLTAGAGLTGGGDLSANRSFAVGAGTGIVANADDVAVDKASDANIRAAASNKVVTADGIESASAFVALSDAATVAVDWDTFVNATLELTTNRVLGNPTNGQPGTWRTVYVTSDGGPDTLTFGNQYIGPAVDGDALDDIQAATKAYLLTILCITSSLFFVAAAPVEL